MIKGLKMQGPIPKKIGKRVWIHCASLGEFEQARPILERLKKEGIEIILTFFSPSGYEQRENYEHADWIGYLPFDSKANVRAFLNEMEPDLVIFIKYEFWWNYVNGLIIRNIPFVFVSVVLRKEHYLFKKWASSFLDLLKKASAIYLIDQPSFLLLQSRGFKNIESSGDTRIESILDRKNSKIEDEVIENFVGDDPCIIFGSTYPIEESEITRISDELISDYKLLIFPHNIDLKDLQSLKDQLGKHCMLYSELKQRSIFTDYKILIIDKIGLLRDAYRYATIVYVGGGLTSGLHNTLEPFVYKVPLIFGRNFEKFPEARFFAEQKFVKVIEKVNGLRSGIEELSKEDLTKEIDIAYSIIFDDQGKASTQILSDIKKILWKERE